MGGKVEEAIHWMAKMWYFIWSEVDLSWMLTCADCFSKGHLDVGWRIFCGRARVSAGGRPQSIASNWRNKLEGASVCGCLSIGRDPLHSAEE